MTYAQLVIRSSQVSRSSSTEAAVLKNSKTSTTLTNNHKARNRNENFGFFIGVSPDSAGMETTAQRNPFLLEHSENVKSQAG